MVEQVLLILSKIIARTIFTILILAHKMIRPIAIA